jgi:Tol biopolymer transport system component
MKKTILSIFVILLAGCAPGDIQIPQSPALKFLERKSGLIAYIGGDGNLYITDQGATSVTQVTDDITSETQDTMAYQQPTWSPDGEQLAFLGLKQTGANELTADIFVSDTRSEETRSVFTSTSEYPFFLYWSPDGETLTALTTTASQQTLALQSIPVNGGEPRVLDTGNPFYWSWAPDGKTMIIHKNGDGTNPADQLSFLRLGDEVTEFVLPETPASFQAPAWSPDGASILLTTRSDDGAQQIALADSTGVIKKTVADFDLNTSFAWAPDSEQFAYITGQEELRTGTLGSLHVANLEDEEEIVIENNIFAFFWSPDSREIAYLIPFVAQPEDSTEQIFYFELHILDVASGESRKIASYQPTDIFLSTVPYIDQYHQSMTIWSPDSNNLVLTFVDSDGVSGIAVVPSSGITEPRILVEGSYAVWSWR